MFDVIVHLKKTSSTMDVAREILPFLSAPFIVISEEQKSGYGQLNRKWFSPPGGLWFTEVFKFSLNEPLSLFTSVIIINVLGRYISDIKVKWPNDIYLHGKKLAGILTDIANETAIVGIGINVENDIPDKIKGISTSLISCTSLDKYILFKEILAEQNKQWKIFMKEGFMPFMDFYNSHLIFLNKKIKIRSKSIVEGMVLGVNKNGALLIKTKSEVESIFSGTVLKF